MNESDPEGGPTRSGNRGAFSHVRRRDYGDAGYKQKDVDSARQALVARLLAQSGVAATAGFLMGLFVEYKSPGPVPWFIVFPVGLGLVAYLGGMVLMEGGGRFAGTLHAPSGKSTPPEQQYSAAQSLVARGHYLDAVAAYEKAIAADDLATTPYLQIARILRDHLQRYEESADWFRRLRNHPNVEAGRAFLAVRELTELYTHKLNRPRDALPLLARLAETRPDSPEGDWAARELAELKAIVFPEASE